MPADVVVRERLTALLVALKQQLACNKELLEATRSLERLAQDPNSSDEALQASVKAHAAVFDSTQSAQEVTRREQFAIQDLMGLKKWDLGEVKHFVRMHVPQYWGSEEQTLVEGIAAVADELRALTERLVTLTAHVEGLLQKGIKSVGNEARNASRGRHVANAYASRAGSGFARFIDKRE